MAPIYRSSIFNKLKPMLQRGYAKADFNTFRPQHTLAETSKDLQQSIRNQTHVSTTLATHLLSNKFPNSNVVFSPLSIHAVLSIVAAGSKDKTLDQVLAFLKTNTTDELNSLYSQLVSLILADGSPIGGPRLSFANGVWVDETVSVKSSFKQVLDTVYKADCSQVDFKQADVVANKVNLWAEKQTTGLIKQIITTDAIKSLTCLIFVNAVYFKGAWSQTFYPSWTKEYDFHLLNGNKVQVPFMTNNKNQFVREYDDMKVLGLPYVQGQDKREFMMYFFLPHAKDGLQSLTEKISSTSDFVDRHIPRSKVEIGKFLIPKFKISFGFEASNMLKEFGLVLPFNKEEGMTEMVQSSLAPNVYVTSIYHKSVVEVNEEGTEAAAATSMYCPIGSSRNTIYDLVDFVADHPFLFVIREDVTGVVLFMGQVIDPSLKQ